MSDTISRRQAIEALRRNQEAYLHDNYFDKIVETDIETLTELPSAEPERKKGKWIRTVLGSTSGYGTTVMYQCTECERMSISIYNFCPNCGADMRGKQDE
jgi:lipopolysaccharide biosynthesis regulator YciM